MEINMYLKLAAPKSRLHGNTQTAVLTLFTLGLAGCSGGGGNITSTITPAVTGAAIKGPLQGAEAFIDVDGDGIWTEGTDSAKATTDADGNFSISNPSNLSGDIVIVTNEDTIDTSRDDYIDGVTLRAPEGYEVVSPATTVVSAILADPDNSSMTADEAAAAAKTALGLGASIDLDTFNPFGEGVDATEALKYEKKAQQVFAIANALSEVEVEGGSSKGEALSNALNAVVNVIASSGTEVVLSEAAAIDDVVTELQATSTTFSAQVAGAASGSIASLKTTIAVVNSALDEITSISDKASFAKAQSVLQDVAKQAAVGEASTIDSLDDLANLIAITGSASKALTEGAESLEVSGQLTAVDPDESDAVTYSFSEAVEFVRGTDASGSALQAAVGTMTITAEGAYTFTVEEAAIDALKDGQTITQTFKVTAVASEGESGNTKLINITINGTNDAPTVTSEALTEATEDAAYSYTLTATDAEGEDITLSASTTPDWLSFDAETGVLSGTPSNDEVGDHAVTLVVEDATGGATEQTFTITVANTNDAPVFASTSDETGASDAAEVAENTDVATVVYTASASDVDVGDTITYSISDETNFTIDPDTGAVTLNEAANYEGQASYEFTVYATDVEEATDEIVVTLTVTDVDETPTVESAELSLISNQDTFDFNSLDLSAAAFVTDPEQGTLSFASIAIAEGSTDYGSLDAETGIFTPAEGLSEDVSVVFDVTISDGTNTTDSFQLTLPVVDAIPIGSGDEDGTITISTAALPEGLAAVSSITIDAASAEAGTLSQDLTTFTPAQDFYGKVMATITLADDTTLPAIITVANVNDDAVWGGDASATTATEDTAITTAYTVSDADGPASPTIAYSWKVGETEVSTESSYTPLQADVGSALSLTLSITDSGGNSETNSVSFGTVANVNDVATGDITISGTGEVGSTITSDVSTIADEDGLENVEYTYSWFADGTQITGASESTYVVTEAEVNKEITAKVSFADDLDGSEEKTSTGITVPPPKVIITSTTVDADTGVYETTISVDFDVLTALYPGEQDWKGFNVIIRPDGGWSGFSEQQNFIAEDSGEAVVLEVANFRATTDVSLLGSNNLSLANAAEPVILVGTGYDFAKFKAKNLITGDLSGQVEIGKLSYSLTETTDTSFTLIVDEGSYVLTGDNRKVYQDPYTSAVDVTTSGTTQYSFVDSDDVQYYLVTDAQSYADAKATAVSMGGTLAKVTSSAENAFIYNSVQAIIEANNLTAPTAADGGGSKYVWIGLNDVATEDTFVWADDSALGSYSNWGSGAFGNEPDNYEDQDGVGIGLENWPAGSADGGGYGDASYWNDIDVSNELFFVVEIA